MAAEKKAAEKLGMAWVSFPMSAWSAPTDQDVDQMLALLQQNGHGIIYLHCKHGQDRTGLIMGLYRFFADKWTAPQAWDEMLKLGYHTLFTEMTDYFEKRTHWNGPVGTF